MGKVNIDWHTGRQPMQVDVKKLVYEKAELQEGNGAQYQDIKGRLFKATYAKGTSPIYIIASPTSSVHTGNDQSIYMRPATKDEITEFFTPINSDAASIITNIAGECHISAGQNARAINVLKKLIEYHKEHGPPLFMAPILPIPREDIVQRDDLPELIGLGLTDGLDKDQRLLHIAKLLLPIVLGDESYIAPWDYMASAPHGSIITPTKTGKTTTLEKVGYIEERPTAANLAGFSTAKDKITGALHRRVRPTIADGIEEMAEEAEAVKGLLNCMEKGRARIARGRGIEVKTYSTLIFTTNPLSSQQPQTQLEKNIFAMQQFLKQMHSNARAIGSRIGLFLFDPMMSEVEKSGVFSRHVQRELRKLLVTVQELLKLPFTAVLSHPKVDRWLVTIDERIQTYNKKLEKMADEVSGWPQIADFIRGHTTAYHHIRGAALRAATMDFVSELIQVESLDGLSGTLVDQILARANTNLEYIIEMNLDSFAKLSKLQRDSRLMEKLIAMRIQGLKNRGKQYEEMLLYCITRWFISQKKDDFKWDISLSVLRQHYLSIPLEKRKNSAYGSFNSLCKAVEKNFDKINQRNDLLGLQLKKIDGAIMIEILPNHHWMAALAVRYGLIKDKKEYQFYQFYQSEEKEIGKIGNIGKDKNSIKEEEPDEEEWF